MNIKNDYKCFSVNDETELTVIIMLKTVVKFQFTDDTFIFNENTLSDSQICLCCQIASCSDLKQTLKHCIVNHEHILKHEIINKMSFNELKSHHIFINILLHVTISLAAENCNNMQKCYDINLKLTVMKIIMKYNNNHF